MHPSDYIALSLTFLSVVLIPLLVSVVRVNVRWTRVEDKLESVVKDLQELVADKDKTHSDIVAQMQQNFVIVNTQMREDRQATNQRLRWLEEHLWGVRERGRKDAI